MGSGLRLLRCLRDGEIVLLKGDRVPPRASAKAVVPIDWLGGRASFPRGPARIARAADARVLFAVALRTGRLRYRIVVRELSLGASDEALVKAYAEALADVLRQHPDQWFNFYPFWDEDIGPVEQEPVTVPRILRRAAWVIPVALAALAGFRLLS